MSTRVQHIVVDDLDGTTDTVTSHRFACDGVEYAIDLSEANSAALRAALAPFITAGRRLPKNTTTTGRRAAGGTRSGAARIRAWWADEPPTAGLPAHRSHGAIPVAVRTAYRLATS